MYLGLKMPDIASVWTECLGIISAVTTFEATEATASVKICSLRKNLACSEVKNWYFP